MNEHNKLLRALIFEDIFQGLRLRCIGKEGSKFKGRVKGGFWRK